MSNMMTEMKKTKTSYYISGGDPTTNAGLASIM